MTLAASLLFADCSRVLGLFRGRISEVVARDPGTFRGLLRLLLVEVMLVCR